MKTTDPIEMLAPQGDIYKPWCFCSCWVLSSFFIHYIELYLHKYTKNRPKGYKKKFGFFLSYRMFWGFFFPVIFCIYWGLHNLKNYDETEFKKWIQFKSGRKTWTKKIYKWQTSLRKDGNINTIEELQPETAVRRHHTAVRMTETPTLTPNAARVGVTGPLAHWRWEGKMVWPLWKRV